jgi:ATP-dependent HslUV protease subunit HslV
MKTAADKIQSTTVLCVRKNGNLAIGADGQVSFGETIMKHSAKKIRTLSDGKVLAGFAGSVADAFTLFEKFESKMEQYPTRLMRASVELSKEWRTDKYLRNLEALLIVANKDNIFLLSGKGDVIEPDEGVIAIGSGGNYAYAAARALVRHSKLNARQIVEESLKIAADICVYTNSHINIEELS